MNDVVSVVLCGVCLIASTMGVIAGFGGGVIIKPVIDALGIFPVSTVSFLSGCTVLSMSISSLIKGRKDTVKLNVKVSTPLAAGAVVGGLIGKYLFQLVKIVYTNENVLGCIQSILLLIITIGVFLYIRYKEHVTSKHVENFLACIFIGACLGILSSFLGIGGGPANVAALFFFFSMEAKESAKNSIYIIMFSQIASIVISILNNTIPIFNAMDLVLMCFGGIFGAIIGASIAIKFDERSTEKFLMAYLIVIILLNVYNSAKFAILIF